MTEIMLSVRPKWCELIAIGRKTIEVRKTKPKCDVPFKVYIYCTQSRIPVYYDGSIVMFEDDLAITNRFGRGKHIENPYGMLIKGEFILNCTVIGEFVCDRIVDVDCDSVAPFDKDSGLYIDNQICIDREQFLKYTRFRCCFGWHISDLIIYDKPKDLSDFDVKRPPQSWCYTQDNRRKGDKL